jgi:hypothetical protein
MSELIWLDMYTTDAAFGVSPHDIVRVVLLGVATH